MFNKFSIKKLLIKIIVLTLTTTSFNYCLLAENFKINSILASIDGEPVSLQDIQIFSGKNLSDSTSRLELNNYLKAYIDLEILEREARKNKIIVQDKEIENYIEILANKNSLSKVDFIAALKAQGISEHLFKTKTKLDILKSKLALQVLGKQITVNNQNNKIASNQHIKKGNLNVNLAQIVLSFDKYSPKESSKILNEISTKFKKSPNSFFYLANKYSTSPEAQSGGKLPTIAYQDLSPKIQTAIKNLKNLELSKPIIEDNGYRLLLLIEKITPEESKKQELSNSQEELRNKKIEEKATDFFINQVYKKYSVEYKI